MRIRAFLHLIRIRYLLPIVAIFVAVRMGFVFPVFEAAGLRVPLAWGEWGLLLLSTLLVAVGSSIINDYFDQREDRTTRPEVAVVGHQIGRRAAMRWHIALSTLAFFLALYPSYRYGCLSYALVFPVSAGLFWFYSTVYKNQFLLGNVLLALMAFALPFVSVAYQVQAVNTLYWREVALDQLSIQGLWVDTLLFALAVGLLVFAYTLVRDCRNFVGNQAMGADSLPVRIGIRPAKLAVAIFLFALQLFLLAKPVWLFLQHFRSSFVWYRLGFVLLFAALPLLAGCFNLLSADRPKQLGVTMGLIVVATWAVVLLPLLYYLPIY